MRFLKLCFISLTVLTSNSVLGDMGCAGNCETKMVTDYSGKPPFKRKIVTLPVVDIAQAEIVDTDTELVSVRTTDFSGKPPFKRTVERLPAVDISQVESLASDSDQVGTKRTDFKGRPPFKRNR